MGVNRGFHGALDAVYAAHRFSIQPDDLKAIDQIREESYKYMDMLGMGLQEWIKEGKKWTADPVTRYTNLEKDRRLAAKGLSKIVKGAE